MSIEQVTEIVSRQNIENKSIKDSSSSIFDNIQEREIKIHKDISKASSQTASYQNIPSHIKERFQVWEASLTSSEDKKLLEETKKIISSLTSFNDQDVFNKIEGKQNLLKVELLLKATNKSFSSIQQLLSSQ